MKKISRFFNRLISSSKSDQEYSSSTLGDPPEIISSDWKVGNLVLDRYQIIEKMSGAMGHVYICDHISWGIRMALKAPRPEVLGDQENAARILREADAWIRMGMHPNIATCYYVLTFNNTPHLFIEYVNGGNLHQWVQTGRLRDLRNILSLAVQFCHGMEFTHSKGIIHRDIKPQNILITQDSLLKITDFGIVLDLRKSEIPNGHLDQASHENSNATQGFLGTPGYASPEQFFDTHRVDGRSDLYSFGLCLWLMLCGKKPFERNDLELSIPDPVSCIKGVQLTKSLQNILTKCVAFDPDDRFQNFKELRLELNSVYNEIYNVPCPYARLEHIDMRAESLNNYAVSLFELGETDDAIQCLFKALDLNDNLVQAIYNLAVIQWRAGIAGPANLIKNIESADKRLGSPDILAPLVVELKKWARKRREGGTPNYPDFKLCLPPSSTNVYRENQLLQSVHSTINTHLKSKRNQECAETLIASWRNQHFIRNKFYTGTYEKLVKLGQKENVAGLFRLNTLSTGSSPIISIATLDGGKNIFYLTRDGKITSWSLADKKREQINNSTYTCMITGQNKKILVAGSNDGTVYIIPYSKNMKQVSFKHKASVSALSINYTSEYIAAGFESGEIILYSINKYSKTAHFSQNCSIISILFLEDDETIITGDINGDLNIWQPPYKQSTRKINAHSGPVIALKRNHDSRFFLSTGADGVIRSIENNTGRIIRSSDLNDKHPTGSLLLDDNATAVTGGKDDIIELWDLKDDRNTFSLDARGDGILCLSKGPRPHIFLAGCKNGKILLAMVIHNLSFR